MFLRVQTSQNNHGYGHIEAEAGPLTASPREKGVRRGDRFSEPPRVSEVRHTQVCGGGRRGEEVKRLSSGRATGGFLARRVGVGGGAVDWRPSVTLICPRLNWLSVLGEPSAAASSVPDHINYRVPLWPAGSHKRGRDSSGTIALALPAASARPLRRLQTPPSTFNN
ncbi:hypothetical protein AAFF_G00294070 [Aldrovandia affinis]|uniref:Uncharacterized protein n=1 Tax=Aldrovandia affinis TaxID=143900 RepID=A0AAD7R9S5_9TELE|nr:hypothetical protein AAFF_G00294070 [Aldrovandia affinis]